MKITPSGIVYSETDGVIRPLAFFDENGRMGEFGHIGDSDYRIPTAADYADLDAMAEFDSAFGDFEEQIFDPDI